VVTRPESGTSAEQLSIGILSSDRCACGQQNNTYQSVIRHKGAYVRNNNHLFLHKPALHWNTVFGSMRLGQQDKTCQNEKGYKRAHVKSKNHLFLDRAILHWNAVFGSMRPWTARQDIPRHACEKQQSPVPLQNHSPLEYCPRLDAPVDTRQVLSKRKRMREGTQKPVCKKNETLSQ